jgi:alkaline phosphatase D
MRYPLLLITTLLSLFIALPWAGYAQNGLPYNMYADTAYYPFIYGVASGDPLQDRVILWTKVVTAENSTAPVQLRWQIANDSLFTNNVNSGTAICEARNHYTTQTDATGLQPGQHYYYRFITADGKVSQTGKTLTLPPDTTTHFKIALASCSGVWSGYFNAYRRMAERSDIDYIIHVGDYIYDDVDPDEQVRMPAFELKSPSTLAEWRERHRYYLLDPDLRYARQQKPWIVEWDNHDTHYKAAEKNSDGITAFYEYVPIRKPDTLHPENIYRSFRFGNLADLHMIDMYMFRGDEEYTTGSKSILGNRQDAWFKNSLKQSTTTWHLVGNQEMMGSWLSEGIPKVLPAPGNGVYFNPSDWDGYPADRNRLYRFIDSNLINNLVVLSGDLHMSFIIDLTTEPRNKSSYNKRTGKGAIGVEVLTPSITAGNMDEEHIPGYLIPLFQSVSKRLNAHHRWVQFSKHGYTTIDVTPQQCVAQFYYSEILNTTNKETVGKKFIVQDGANHWQRRNKH